jgi:hypothetical protein
MKIALMKMKELRIVCVDNREKRSEESFVQEVRSGDD